MADRIDKVWIYRGTSNGKTEEGIVQAATKEEAEARTKRLGFDSVVIVDGDVKVPFPPAPIPIPSAPSVPPLPSGIQEVRLQQREMNRNLTDTAKTVEKQVQAAAVHAAGIAADMKRTTRQSIVYGDEGTAMTQANGLLEKNGRVVHALMRPDHHGKMKLLFVIEHEEKRK